MLRVSRREPASRLNPISSKNCEHFFRGALSPLPVQEFVIGAARSPTRNSSPSWIDDKRREAGHGAFNSASALQRGSSHQLWFLYVARSDDFPLRRSEPCRMAERQT